MKTGFIDSSFLLSLILEDSNYDNSWRVWDSLDLKLGSLILNIETHNNNYKYNKMGKKNDQEYREKADYLDDLLATIHKKEVGWDIFRLIQENDILKRPKSLDSIHLATALSFMSFSENKIIMCSYDKNLCKAAQALGMALF